MRQKKRGRRRGKERMEKKKKGCESKGSLLFLTVPYAIPEECSHLLSLPLALSGFV